MPEYRSWIEMRRRCTNNNRAEYKNYGGRGITICQEWNKFSVFLKDMGQRPLDHTLDRIDNNGNYEPTNCRWADIAQQNQNKRPRNIERNAFWHKLKAKGYTYSQISYIVNAPWQTVVSGIRTYELKKKEGALNVSKAE